ncbi:MAG: tRNA lysidine(34) synthetase TilS [Burkholderiales bacterium]|nr:tRNA lysidine(34) synthetase TilS [Burkholderiales bacterium]
MAQVAGKHVSPGDHVVLGLSGGLDSVVLLHLLRELSSRQGFILSCLHVNHSISPNASLWVKFCEDLCKKLEVPLSVENVDISPHLSSGIEAAARIARYAAFGNMKAHCIALAQHRDDQAETVLLQLFRGAGPKGLAAMGEATPFRDKFILRPLLGVARRTLEAFAQEKNLEWVRDESNADIRFDRNFVRHNLIPVIEQRFPSCRETISRAAGHFSEAAGLLDELAAIDASGAVIGGRLSVARLQGLSEARAKNLLRHYLCVNNIRMPGAERLGEMLKQFSSARQDAHISIRHEGFDFRCFRGFVHIVKPLPIAAGFFREWHGEPRMHIAELGGDLVFETGTGGINAQKLTEPVTIRVREGGERFRPYSDRPVRRLKNLFQENGIPPWQRDSLPLLYCGEHLIWVSGIGLDPEYRADKGLVPRWEICDIDGKA